jgi:hypothetical protein
MKKDGPSEFFSTSRTPEPSSNNASKDAFNNFTLFLILVGLIKAAPYFINQKPV